MGEGKGFLWIAAHVAWTPALTRPIPEEEEEAEQTSFE